MEADGSAGWVCYLRCLVYQLSHKPIRMTIAITIISIMGAKVIIFVHLNKCYRSVHRGFRMTIEALGLQLPGERYVSGIYLASCVHSFWGWSTEWLA